VAVRKYIQEIEKAIQSDTENLTIAKDAGWDAESLREEARSTN